MKTMVMKMSWHHGGKVMCFSSWIMPTYMMPMLLIMHYTMFNNNSGWHNCQIWLPLNRYGIWEDNAWFIQLTHLQLSLYWINKCKRQGIKYCRNVCAWKYRPVLNMMSVCCWYSLYFLTCAYIDHLL